LDTRAGIARSICDSIRSIFSAVRLAISRWFTAVVDAVAVVGLPRWEAVSPSLRRAFSLFPKMEKITCLALEL
jgi:hypothetical protein